MDNTQIANMLMIALMVMFCILIVLVLVWLILKFKSKQLNQKVITEDGESNNTTKIQQMYNVQSIFKFMEFEKIEDNMIVQNKGKKFLMVIKCQGINYDLMSGVEKTSVEQGFIQFLNTLRYPIQIYVQTRTVDLGGSLNTYKQKVRTLGDNLAQKEFEYNQKVRSGVYEQKELDKEHFEVVKARNLYEYGMDIVGNTERMSLNKNILSKQYYVVVPYYIEDTNMGNYIQEEIKNIAFSELYTRAQSIISLLSVCGINSKILDSVELANLLYMAYNRDEAETYDLEKAIKSGYDEMYTTAPDVLEKRMRALDKQMEIDAIQKANEAVFKVKDEQEKERKIREKERNYKEMVANMAKIVLENNRDILGDEVTEKAKEKITTKKSKKSNSESKEETVNEQKTIKKSGRPRKTA